MSNYLYDQIIFLKMNIIIMASIIKQDYVSVSELKNITGIALHNNTAYISSKNCGKKLASYHIANVNNIQNFMISNTFDYIDLITENIRSISSYENYLIIVLKDEFKIIVLDILKMITRELIVMHQRKSIQQFCIDEILKISFRCDEECFNLMSVSIVGKHMYLFVQSNCIHNKGYMLYIIQTHIHNNMCSTASVYELKSFFNLYNNGKLAGLSKENSKILSLSDSIYDSEKSAFILLFIFGESGNNGYFATVDRYSGFSGIGTCLKFITNCNHRLFMIENKPRGLAKIKKNNYLVITNDSTGHNTENDHKVKYMVIRMN